MAVICNFLKYNLHNNYLILFFFSDLLISYINIFKITNNGFRNINPKIKFSHTL